MRRQGSGAVTGQLRLLLAVGGAALPDLRYALVGGSKLDPALRAAMAQMAPACVVHEFYGAAEASFITLAGPNTPPDAVGSAYPGVELRVSDGEVWVKSPYLFEGYAMGESAETRWQDGFLTVGELGWLDPQGYLYLAGRKRRMVLIADQNTFPEEIESFLLAQAGVAHCAVIAQPDPARGHHLVAVIGGTPDADLAEALDAASRAAFGPLKAPKRYVFLEDFPCLASGKPDITALALRIDG